MKMRHYGILFILIGMQMVMNCSLTTMTPSMQCFLNAIHEGNIERLQELHNQDNSLIHQIYPDTYAPLFKNTALVYAIQAKKVGIVALLIHLKANIATKDKDNCDHTPLHWAVKENVGETVQLLIENGADTEAVAAGTDYTTLHWAVINRHRGIVEQLIKAGANLEAQARQGITPLCAAVIVRSEEIVETLLVNKANVEGALFKSNDSKHTPLCYAFATTLEKGEIDCRDAEIIKILLLRGNASLQNVSRSLHHDHAHKFSTVLKKMGFDIDTFDDTRKKSKELFKEHPEYKKITEELSYYKVPKVIVELIFEYYEVDVKTLMFLFTQAASLCLKTSTKRSHTAAFG